MTREELLTAAREAKAWREGQGDDGTALRWMNEDELFHDFGMEPEDALFISLASPDTILELLGED